jgi:hypothetical protein
MNTKTNYTVSVGDTLVATVNHKEAPMPTIYSRWFVQLRRRDLGMITYEIKAASADEAVEIALESAPGSTVSRVLPA